MKIIDEKKINQELSTQLDVSNQHLDEILSKARELKGISYNEVLTLLNVSNTDQLEKIFGAARFVKDEIYGNRLVIFAPLYISNLCNNECLYCAFRNKNNDLKRKALDQEEIKEETVSLINSGHKRTLLVAGESYGQKGLDYVFDSIDTVYETKTAKGNIRRVNVNIAPLSIDEFKLLNQKKIGTYQLFQETYHQPTYKKLHLKGPKSNYDYRLETMGRAFEAGIKDVGVGILFGLYDWKFEILALLEHINFLEKNYGIGPHTISIPRMEPAFGSNISYDPPYPVDDISFKKIISVLRLAVPYTGIILSTRENAKMRRDAFDLGISQISAGSKTNPGGYHENSNESKKEEQFSLGDHRSLHDVILDIVECRHIPSFCTGCYRLGRIGKDFMDLAKPGLIKAHCLPNAMFTFAEYLADFADKNLQEKGHRLIKDMIDSEIKDETKKKKVLENILKINEGKRDIYF